MPHASTGDSFAGFYEALLKLLLIDYQSFLFSMLSLMCKTDTKFTCLNSQNYKYVTGKKSVLYTKWATRHFAWEKLTLCRKSIYVDNVLLEKQENIRNMCSAK